MKIKIKTGPEIVAKLKEVGIFFSAEAMQGHESEAELSDQTVAGEKVYLIKFHKRLYYVPESVVEIVTP